MSTRDQEMVGYWLGKRSADSKMVVTSINDDEEGYISIEIEGVGNLALSRWKLVAALAVIQEAADTKSG